MNDPTLYDGHGYAGLIVDRPQASVDLPDGRTVVFWWPDDEEEPMQTTGTFKEIHDNTSRKPTKAKAKGGKKR